MSSVGGAGARRAFDDTWHPSVAHLLRNTTVRFATPRLAPPTAPPRAGACRRAGAAQVRRGRATLCDYTPATRALFLSLDVPARAPARHGVLHEAAGAAPLSPDDLVLDLPPPVFHSNSARELSSARMADFSLPPSQAIPHSRRQPRGHQRGISEGGVRDWSAALGGLHLHGSRAPPTTPSHGQGGQQWGGGTGGH